MREEEERGGGKRRRRRIGREEMREEEEEGEKMRRDERGGGQRRGGRGEEEDEGYLDNISDRQEVSFREDALFLVLLFVTLHMDDVNRRRRRNFDCVQLLCLLSTQKQLSVTSD